MRPGAGMMTSGGYGASGVGWLSLVLFWVLAIVGLVLVVWRSRNAGQSGPGVRPRDGRWHRLNCRKRSEGSEAEETDQDERKRADAGIDSAGREPRVDRGPPCRLSNGDRNPQGERVCAR